MMSSDVFAMVLSEDSHLLGCPTAFFRCVVPNVLTEHAGIAVILKGQVNQQQFFLDPLE
jgi:hypothetical protein